MLRYLEALNEAPIATRKRGSPAEVPQQQADADALGAAARSSPTSHRLTGLGQEHGDDEDSDMLVDVEASVKAGESTAAQSSDNERGGNATDRSRLSDAYQLILEHALVRCVSINSVTL